MPVRINLKELFGSDSQEITVDKLNFNFNKLLSLGIGLEGVKGLTGGTGSIGPAGVKGAKGDKGNQWFVGSDDPNVQTFTGLMDDDFYVLSDNSQIWQYDLITDTWNVVIDLGGIVNDYLNSAGTTFVRGFGDSSPQDSRYIVFPNRGNTVPDQDNDNNLGTSTSNNDILLLSNFNENGVVYNISDDLSDTDEYYTALQKIYVDRTNPVSKRYHLELGSLNDISGSPYKLSEIGQNLKIRHEYESGLFNGVFSISKRDSDSETTITNNGIFNFIYPRYNASGPTVQAEGFIQIGSRYAHAAMGRTYAEFDGINFNISGPGTGNAGIGIGYNFSNILTSINGRSFLLLSTDTTSITGIMLDTDTYQDNGNIEQLGTGLGEIKTIPTRVSTGLAFTPQTYGNAAIAASGNFIYQAEGTSGLYGTLQLLDSPSFIGYYFASDVTNPGNPKPTTVNSFTGLSQNTAIPNDYKPVGAAVCDVDVNGNFLYFITNQQSGTYTEVTSGPNLYHQSNLQIVQFNPKTGSNWQAHSYLGGTANNYIDGAHRIKIAGNKAIVVSNHLRDWGPSGGTAAASQYEHAGTVTSIDISDPANPKVTAVKSEARTHHLDLAISKGYAYTVAIDLGAPSASQHLGHNVKIHRYNLEETETGLTVSSGTLTGTPLEYQLSTSASNVGYSAHNDITSGFNKFGAISVSGHVIHVAHSNKLYTTKHDGNGGTIVAVNTLNYDADPYMRSMDMKVVGESLYILCASGNETSAYAPTASYIVKVNISNITTPIVVSKTNIGDPSASKLIIVGNTIYVNKTNGSGAGYLIPIEIDGFKSDAANIGSIKSTDINVTNNLTVGNSINAGQSLTVGKGGISTIGHIASKSMANDSKIWYRGIISGVTSAGVVTRLNENHGTKYDTDWVYQISMAESVNGATSKYVVYYDGPTSTWKVRTISKSSDGSVGSISISGDNFKITAASGTHTYTYNVEATFTDLGSASAGSLISPLHMIGSDMFFRMEGGTSGFNLNKDDGDITLANTLKLGFKSASGNTSTFKSASASVVNIDYTLPAVAPTAGQVLTSTAGGVLSWGSTASAGGWTDLGATVHATSLSANIGIGLVGGSVSAKLHIYKNDAIDIGGMLKIEQGGSGDPSVQFVSSDATSYILGIDRSDSSKFKINDSTGLTGARFTIHGATIGINKEAPTVGLDIVGISKTTFASRVENISSNAFSGAKGLEVISNGTSAILSVVSGQSGSPLSKFEVYHNHIKSLVPYRSEDGLVSAPSYSFRLDTTTGIYRKSTSSVGISGGNAELFSVSKTSYALINSQVDNPVGSGLVIDDTSASNSGAMWMTPRLSSGSFNWKTTAGDFGIFWNNNGYNNGIANTSGFVLSPHSNSYAGLRIGADGAVVMGSTAGKVLDMDGSTSNHCYLEFNSSKHGGRHGWLGFGSASNDNMTYHNEVSKKLVFSSGLNNSGGGNIGFQIVLNNGGAGAPPEIGSTAAGTGGHGVYVYAGGWQNMSANSFIPISDARLKTDIISLDTRAALDAVVSLNAVNYKMTSDLNTNRVGFIAQEVEPYIPEVVKYPNPDEDFSDKNSYGLNYSDMVAYNSAAIQELNLMILERDNRINELESRLAAIESHLGI
jgi:hypothetical protein